MQETAALGISIRLLTALGHLSLVYVLSITDFLGAASKVAQRDGRLVEMCLFAALVYFVISFVASLLVRRLQRRVAIIPLRSRSANSNLTGSIGVLVAIGI